MTATIDRPSDADGSPPARGKKPAVDGQRGIGVQIAVYFGVLLPIAAVAVAVPFAWGWGLSWLDVGLFVFFYVVLCMGIIVKIQIHFTNVSLMPAREIRLALT